MRRNSRVTDSSYGVFRDLSTGNPIPGSALYRERGTIGDLYLMQTRRRSEQVFGVRLLRREARVDPEPRRRARPNMPDKTARDRSWPSGASDANWRPPRCDPNIDNAVYV